MIRLKPQQYPQFAKQFWKEQTRWEMTDCCFDNPLEQGIFWVDRLEQPQCVAVLLGDFLFLQGSPFLFKAGSCQKRLAVDGRAGLAVLCKRKLCENKGIPALPV